MNNIEEIYRGIAVMVGELALLRGMPDYCRSDFQSKALKSSNLDLALRPLKTPAIPPNTKAPRTHTPQ